MLYPEMSEFLQINSKMIFFTTHGSGLSFVSSFYSGHGYLNSNNPYRLNAMQTANEILIVLQCRYLHYRMNRQRKHFIVLHHYNHTTLVQKYISFF